MIIVNMTLAHCIFALQKYPDYNLSILDNNAGSPHQKDSFFGLSFSQLHLSTECGYNLSLLSCSGIYS